MSHKLEDSEGEKEAAEGKGNTVDFFDGNEELEGLEKVTIYQVNFLFVFYYDFDVFGDADDEHCR
jgi:hypothetical protein